MRTFLLFLLHVLSPWCSHSALIGGGGGGAAIEPESGTADRNWIKIVCRHSLYGLNASSRVGTSQLAGGLLAATFWA